MRYKVVTESSVNKLEDSVNMFMEIGWEISGPLVIRGYSYDSFLQPMIHREA